EKLSPERFRHSLCVAESAAELADRYGADVEKARIAGVLHDIMKDAGRARQLEEIEEIDELTRRTPKLLHAPAGAAYIRRKLGITDPDILAAVRYHTTARAGMSPLEKVIYIADFISADRDYPDVYVMRALATVSLGEAMRYALCYTIRDLAERGKLIHPDTVAAFNECMIHNA
ncbi:MAG: bis(5'-nucleosyl)-tetraphosphatase (symmetrical) YqeK, partial [Oscillospiraceae bacterium]|nr:bis(5'-nucleosyl)-tetraphosphatase (symmetrical) YqeK [Oscillospiraceae bacterium]